MNNIGHFLINSTNFLLRDNIATMIQTLILVAIYCIIILTIIVYIRAFYYTFFPLLSMKNSKLFDNIIEKAKSNTKVNLSVGFIEYVLIILCRTTITYVEDRLL